MTDLNGTLILFKGQDRTADVEYLERKGDSWALKFFRSPKIYTCGHDTVHVFTDPEELSPREYLFMEKGRPLRHISRIQKFPRHWRIVFQNGHTRCLAREDAELVHSCIGDPKQASLWDYFNALAECDNLKIDGEATFLSRQYARVEHVPDDTALGFWLRGALPPADEKAPPTLYYPFGFNASQKQAVDRALSHGFSIIEGPPGTGKTQTILNILANLVMSGRTAAVVSGNNSATHNVEEKLARYGLDFLCAFLGSAANREAFVQNQKALPDMSGWRLDSRKKAGVEARLVSLRKDLDLRLKAQNELAALRVQSEALKTEQAHFLETFASLLESLPDRPALRRLDADALLRLLACCEAALEKKAALGFWSRLMLFIRFRVWDSAFFASGPVAIRALCHKLFYEHRLAQTQARIKTLSAELEAWRFTEKMDEYATLSMRLFKHALAQRFEGRIRTVYRNLPDDGAAFLKEYPIVLSTTHSLRSCFGDSVLYDYVIVDEASQVSLCPGALAFSCARRAVVVGDLRQLPNVVDGPTRRITDMLFRRYQVPEAFRSSSHSLLRSVSVRLPGAPRTLLREHYRCHPAIIGFCNEKFYRGELIVLTRQSEGDMPLRVFRTVPGNHARERLNRREIDVIAREVFPRFDLHGKVDEVGIVTPYRAQADALRKEPALGGVAADTVDKFQGQERGTIILSTVDNDISDFADDDHRLNVAVSRAVERLIVVTSGNRPTRRTSIGDLVRYIEYHNMEVTDSKVCSVFDLLYSQYAEVRRQTLVRLKRVSQLDSENLMFGLIEQTLKEEGLDGLGVHGHVPLRLLLRDASLLVTERERQYALNSLTHVDFLIFEKISRRPVAALEVDGWAFHRPGGVQAGRDALKDAICARYGIALFRFSTTGSGEKQRLRAILRELAAAR